MELTIQSLFLTTPFQMGVKLEIFFWNYKLLSEWKILKQVGYS